MKLSGAFLALAAATTLSGCGGGSTAGNVSIRTINFVRGTSAINVTADTAILATGLAYGTPSAYSSLSSYPQQISASDPTLNVSLGSLTLSASAGNFYTLYAMGVEQGSPASTLMLAQDVPPTTSATTGSVRFGDFSTSITGNVDVYLTLVGSTTPLSSLTPNFSNVAYGSVTSYVNLTAGSYKVWVTATGNPTTVETTASPYVVAVGTAYSVYSDDASATNPSVVQLTDSY